MKHGFNFDGSGRIPDYLLLDEDKDSWQKQVHFNTVYRYALYKLARLAVVIKDSVDGGLIGMDHDAYLRLVHRLKAVKATQAEIDSFQFNKKEKHEAEDI